MTGETRTPERTWNGRAGGGDFSLPRPILLKLNEADIAYRRRVFFERSACAQ
jgi:hypothetical protein